MTRRFIAAASAMALITACGGAEKETAKTAGDTTTASETSSALQNAGAETKPTEKIPAIVEEVVTAPVEPISIEFTSDHLSAAANIDGEIGAFAPDLMARIKEEVEADIEGSKAHAAEDAGERAENFYQHDFQADFIKVASVGDIISVESATMIDGGGAHPNFWTGGIIHDRSTGNDLAPSALLSPEGEAEMEALLKDELAKQKLVRMGFEEADLPIMRQDVDEVFPEDIASWFGQVTLIPSTEEDKFGGLVVHYSPYDVGAYAEGSYDILVKASELGTMIDPAFAEMFGGEPGIDFESRD